MVLIWTQFGVKHKNVKCKVRVIHGDDSWNSEEAQEAQEEVPSPTVTPAGKDYYAVLGVPADSNEEEIRRAFRRLALRFHPDKNREADAEEKFKQIAEAYNVLADTEKRSVYDQQGMKKGGVATTAPKGDFSPSRRGFEGLRVFFNLEVDSDSDDLFNPFLSRVPLNHLGRLHGDAAGRRQGAVSVEEHELEVSLEEVFRGVTKRVRVTRLRPGPDGASLRPEERVISVEVKKGWREGTRITFPGAGHQASARHAPSDLAFIIKEKSHAHYRRDGSNIIYTAKITLREALCGCTVDVPTIDNRVMPLPCSDVIKPGSVRRLRGEGLPHAKSPSQRGDLLVEFQVAFPDRIPPPSKEIIKHSLGQC